MTTPAKFAELIGKRLLSLKDLSVSRHLDELIGAAPAFQNYGEWCLAIFLELVSYLRSVNEQRIIAWVIPGAATNTLQTTPLEFQDVVAENTPATVYLLSVDSIFACADEEYRRAIKIAHADWNVGAAFRSWRDLRAAQLGWEFTNDIYMWARFTETETIPVR